MIPESAPTEGQPISPDTFAMMIATIDAGDRAGNGTLDADGVVNAVYGLMKAAHLTVGDYRNFLPGYNQ